MLELLKTIDSPEDLQSLSMEELRCLAKEIRYFLVGSVSKTGGHLASNLGIVELTIALHKCFAKPDKLVWDVGHQAYIHKILTGRRDQFHTLRQLDGLSGFPKPGESEYDAFAAGHSSTSISAALGMAKARDMLGGTEHVIAIIGDGSITGGLAYEGLNNAGREKTNLIVILNDNQMSISNNVGAMSRHLNSLRTGSVYRTIKEEFKKAVDHVPVVGKAAALAMEKLRDSAKYMLLPGVLFEEMGFQYFGPVDGHNIEELISLFQNVKNIRGPVLVHVKTVKGKGYPLAQCRPWDYHGVGSFDVATGKPKSSATGDDFSKIFGNQLVKLAKENDRIVAITAAMAAGTGLSKFQKRFPTRFYDVAIAEQHAVTFGAGLASQGIVPVFAVYSTFLQRAYDQIIHDVCMQKLHVVFAIDRAGVVGADGETHQGIFDLSYLSHIPNMTLLSPKNGRELEEMLTFAVAYDGPIAIRYPRGVPDKALEALAVPPIVLGKAEKIREGQGIAILAEGHMLQYALEAADMLSADLQSADLQSADLQSADLQPEQGHSPMVVNVRFIKPIDIDLIKEISKTCSHIFTVEDNLVSGGLGAQALEWVSKEKIPVSVHPLGFMDRFIPHGTQAQLLERYGLDGKGIYKQIKDCLSEYKDL